MARFDPILDSSHLPAVGAGYERLTLDLKGRGYDPKKAFHIAKDVAAFANHLGGTLLIGAEELNGRVEHYAPLPEAEANVMQTAISRAVGDKCSPRPLVDVVRIPFDGGFVLAANVSPYIGQIVGVRGKVDQAAESYGGNAYVFPVRNVSDSIYLLPEQLPMFMLPEVRRAVILLNSMPKGAEVHVKRLMSNDGFEDGDFQVVAIDELQNTVHMKVLRGTGERFFPLDHIQTVFKRGDTWHVTVRRFD